MGSRRRLLVSVLVAAVVAGGGVVTGGATASAAPRSGTADEPVRPAEHYQAPPRQPAESDVTDPAWVNPEVELPPAESVTVDVPATGWARAGSLPVSVARPADGVAPARVTVRMLSQAEVAEAGGRFIGFEVSRADGGSAPAQLAVTVDYAGVAKAFGGDFAARLRLVRLTACAVGGPCRHPAVEVRNDLGGTTLRAASLAVAPDPSAPQPDGENTGTGPEPGSGFGPQVGDDVSLGQSTTYVAASSSSGQTGDYTASTLSGSDRWGVGIGTGAFTYSYPIGVPPPPAGPEPGLALSYSSQSVDGRTLAENGQAPKAGEGWSFEPGFIERKFPTCGGSSAARREKCWSPNNEYYLHFGGRSAELIRDGATNEWRLRGVDPGWRVLSYTRTGSVHNGDENGEYFVVITPDGTKHWFGLGTEPRNTPTLSTNSVFTVPVVGGSGEPCYNAVLAASWCQQAYRWNLDRVLDTNGNVMSLFYAKETNRYSRHGDPAMTQPYDRSGYLSRVEYGQRNGQENAQAQAQVRVTTANRCADPDDCPAPSPSATGAYPDVPLDLMCTTTTCSAGQDSATFWSTQQIASIRTEYWNAEAATPGYSAVSTYELSYSFPVTNDGTSPSLWLTDIAHKGEWGTGSEVLPPVRLAGVRLQNRVNTGVGLPAMNKWRVSAVRNELDAVINVTYGLPRPCPLDTDIAFQTNPYHCFPAVFDPQDGTAPAWIPFHKYLVTTTNVDDDSTGQPGPTTRYDYLDTPAWHYDDSLLSQNESWADYRGHGDVRVTVDASRDSEATNTRYRTFRGMHGDKLSDTTSKSPPPLVDSAGGSFTDHDYLAGLPLETLRYTAGGGTLLSATLHRYWALQTIDGPNGFQSHDTDFVRESTVIDRVPNLDTGAWRHHERNMAYKSSTGVLVETSDEGQPGLSTDNTCTKHGITENTTTGTTGGDAQWIVDRPWRTITYFGVCGSETTTLARTEYYYDGQAFQAAPAKGNVTETWAYADLGTIAKTRTAYDALGRVVTVRSPRDVASPGTGGVTTTDYLPATGYPYQGVTTTTYLSGANTTTATVVPYLAWGTPRRVTGPNGKTTTIAVDPLGRTTAVTRPMDPAGKPGLTFEYHVVGGAPNRVQTDRLLTADAYVTTFDYLDGFGRLVQTQLPEPDGGKADRRLVSIRYDALGRVAARTQPFARTGAPGDGLVNAALDQIPFETRNAYDSLGRTKWTAQYASGVSKFSTSTTYRGWHHVVDAPVRSDVTYETDVYGRVTTVTELPATGSAVTSYKYTALGDLNTITDDTGVNVTDYDYDWLRRRTESDDPDQGIWETTYDLDGNVQTGRDALLKTLWHGYDRAGRKTQTRVGHAGGTLLAEWTYDDATAGPTRGLLKHATRHTGGLAYTSTVTGYDDRGRPTGREVVVPAAADVPANAARNAVAGTYSYSYGYDLADNLTRVTMPAAGGLPQEDVTTTFNPAGLPDKLSGLGGDYIAATSYDTSGRLTGHTLPLGPKTLRRSYGYEAAASRLGSLHTQDTAAGGAVFEDLSYGYDDANVTTVVDQATGGLSQRECFRYDPLNRLTEAFTTSVATACATNPVTTAGPDPYHLAYAYNDVGDITSATDRHADPDVTRTYTYTTAGHAHAVTTVGGGPAYEYDNNGATIGRPTPTGTQTLTWDQLHQLAGVDHELAGATDAGFVYDADGTRLLRTTTSTTTTQTEPATTTTTTTATLYLDGTEITAEATQHGTDPPTVTTAAARYYGAVAMRVTTANGGTETRVLLRNYQSSATTALAVSGTGTAATITATRQRYTPFGARRGTTRLPGTDRGYLDKIEDPTGLLAVGARYYDPTISRFTSVDPLTIPLEPQTLAGYSYAGNNPTTFSDPTGLSRDDPDGAGGGCFGECTTTPEEPVIPSPAPQSPPTPGPSSSGSDASATRTIPAHAVCTTPSAGGGAACGWSPERVLGPGPGALDILYTVVVQPFVDLRDNAGECWGGALWGGCAAAVWNSIEIATMVVPLARPATAGVRATRLAKTAKAAKAGGGAIAIRPPLSIGSKQFGAKWGRHAADYGLDPASSSARSWFQGRLRDVHLNPDEVRRGAWRGGGKNYFFFRQGEDLLITQPDGTFVTMFPGASTNGWFKSAEVFPH